MIRLLKDWIAVRIITPTPVSPRTPSVNAANVSGGGTSAEGDGAAASGDSLLSDPPKVAAPPVTPPAPSPAPAPDPASEIQVAKRLAKVVGVGPGKLATNYSGHPIPLIPLKVKVGDVVIIPQILASETVIAADGKEAVLIHECDVLGVIEGDGESPRTGLFAPPRVD